MFEVSQHGIVHDHDIMEKWVTHSFTLEYTKTGESYSEYQNGPYFGSDSEKHYSWYFPFTSHVRRDASSMSIEWGYVVKTLFFFYFP